MRIFLDIFAWGRHTTSDDDKVALHAVQLRHSWENAHSIEAEALEQPQARFVVAEDESEQCSEAEIRAPRYRPAHQVLRDPAAMMGRRNVHAQLRRGQVGRSAIERLETEPPAYRSIVDPHPEWTLTWGVLAETTPGGFPQ